MPTITSTTCFNLYTFDLENGAGYYEVDVVKAARSEFFSQLKDSLSDKITDRQRWIEIENLLESTGLNLRRIKRVLRWLYYEVHIGKISDKLLGNFAELIVSENYSVLWLDGLVNSSVPVRSNIYRGVSSVLAVFRDPDENTRDWNEEIETELADLLTRQYDNEISEIVPQNSFLISISGQIARLNGSTFGSFIATMLREKDYAELQRVYLLSEKAGEICKPDM